MTGPHGVAGRYCLALSLSWTTILRYAAGCWYQQAQENIRAPIIPSSLNQWYIIWMLQQNSHQTRKHFFKSSVVQFWWSWVNSSLMCSPAAVARLLHFTVDSRMFCISLSSLSHCCLPICLKQSDYSPLKSLRHFPQENCCSVDILSFSFNSLSWKFNTASWPFLHG